tara:strand:- start:947 stop:1090 length:144 start_codon:yes stop_codon:yes gene_type:complete
MWRWLLKFCSGSTDLNQNGIPDNEEVLRMIEILAKKLDEIKEQKSSQ